MPDETLRRKDAHLDLCANGDVEPQANDALFSEVSLVHDALPELAVAELDLTSAFLGKPLKLPLLITGMSGGTDRSGKLNHELARVAEELGIAFGVGSQRAMLTDPSSAATFQVRSAAPRVALLGNVGLWQARTLGVDGVRRLMDAIGADGMAIHLNTAQELVQPEGDRDFKGGLPVIAALAKSLGDRLVVKETGCGIGPALARRLADAGVSNIDVSGLGGTSWVRVETLRASGSARAVGSAFSGWGIPTAACVASVASALKGRVRLIASGGIRDGLDVARSIALGAQLAGVALPVFRAWQVRGPEGARAAVEELAAGLKMAMALTGSRKLADLISRPRVIGANLARWIEGLSP
jgi:isopentenyl-diphosphate delta-isomerase